MLGISGTCHGWKLDLTPHMLVNQFFPQYRKEAIPACCSSCKKSIMTWKACCALIPSGDDDGEDDDGGDDGDDESTMKFFGKNS